MNIITKLEVEHLTRTYEINNDKVSIYPMIYNDGRISGEFSFKASENRSSHCILLASRFNQNSIEENGPFPGWFVQIVGNSLSVGVGNGKTWTSVVSSKQIVNNEWYQVAFSLNNQTKIATLYVNGHSDFKENIVFRVPCSFLTVGALNYKGEFRFAGEISGVNIGKGLKDVSHIIETKDVGDADSFIETSKEHLENIRNNLLNLDNDVESLKEIRHKVLSWKYRGLEIDTQLLDNQIDQFIKKRKEFDEDTVNVVDVLLQLDYKIDYVDELSKDDNYLALYGNILGNLKNDIDILNDAKDKLSQFTKLGVQLGNAFDLIEDQKNIIFNQMKQSMIDLKNRENMTLEMMSIVNINDE